MKKAIDNEQNTCMTAGSGDARPVRKYVAKREILAAFSS
jgi:hypothetical protein